MNAPTPAELVMIAQALYGREFAGAESEPRRELLAEAFWIWRQAREVIQKAPLSEKEREQLEETAMLAEAKRCDAEAEALQLAESSGEDIVSWKDTSLWAAVGERLSPGDSPASVADRLHQRFKNRMQQLGRASEVMSEKKGVRRSLAVEILRDDGWKPGPKSACSAENGKISGEGPEGLGEHLEERENTRT